MSIVDAIFATKNVTERPIGVKHLTPPFAITILRGHDSRVAAREQEATTAGMSATPGRARQARLPVDVQVQTLADCGLPCAGDSGISIGAMRSSTGRSARYLVRVDTG